MTADNTRMTGGGARHKYVNNNPYTTTHLHFRLRGCFCRARVVASQGLVCGGEGAERVGCLGYGFLGQGGLG